MVFQSGISIFSLSLLNMLLRIIGGLVFGFIFFYPPLAIAQSSSTVSGKFIRAYNTPLESVTVLLLILPDSMLVRAEVTEKDGSYNFKSVENGTYIITATFIGFKKYTSRPLQLNAGNVITMPPVILMPDPTLLDQVIIRQEKPFLEVKPGKVILNIENSLLSAGSSTYDILKRSPGVQVSGNNISLRGQDRVLISVDNKTIYLTNEELAAFLQNLQSSAVEQIELISNPQAKYEAGGSGIINIKLKKGKNLGFNGVVTTGGGYGEDYKINSGVNLNYRSGRFNTFLMYNFSNNKRPEFVRINRSSVYQDITTEFLIANNDNKTLQNNSYKAGVDFNLNKNNVLGIVYTGFYNTLKSNENNQSLISNNRRLDSTLTTLSVENRHTRNNSVNLNYRLLRPKSNFTVDLDYFDYRRSSNENLAFNFTDSENFLYKELLFGNKSPAHYDITSGKADYSYKLKNATLSAGIKSSYVITDNERRFSKLSKSVFSLDTTFSLDSAFSNRFHLTENINAGYLNYNIRLGSTVLDAGLRVEQTITKGSHRKQLSPIDRNYIDLFPNFQISRTLNKNNQLLLSYSRRIARPSYESLNPFIYFLDLFTYHEGNPVLKPEYLNKYEITNLYKEKYGTTLRFGYFKNPILNILEYNQETKTSTNTDKNYTNERSYSMEITAPFKVSAGWTGNLIAEAFYSEFFYKDNRAFNSTTSYVIATISQDFKISQGLKAEASLHYESRMRYGIYLLKPIYLLDLGLSQAILAKKGSISLSLSDVFNYDRYRYTILLQNLNFNSLEKMESRIFRLNFTYRFGQSIGVNSANRKTGNTEERERLQKVKL